MKVPLPDGLVAFAREFSRFKTPAQRTQGWAEQAGEVRGHGDVLDTVGTLMLWRYLVARDVPTTYLLAGRQGDAADLQVRCGADRGGQRVLSVNVKTSRYEWPDDRCGSGHLFIKRLELEKAEFDVYWQVFVHLEPRAQHGPPHVHIGNWLGRKDGVFVRRKEGVIPGSGDERGFKFALKDLRDPDEFVHLLASRRDR